MKILVIGGAGFIGSHLCELYANNHEVTSLDNYISGKKDNHRGHDKSKYNDGDNGLKNLKPQPSKDNLEYNKDNLIGV